VGQSSRFQRFRLRRLDDCTAECADRRPVKAEIACSAVLGDIVHRRSRRSRISAIRFSIFSRSLLLMGGVSRPVRSGTTSDLHDHMRRLTLTILLIAITACGVSESDEVALGARYAEEIDSQLPMVDDPAVNSYITALGREIASHTERAGLEWHFSVVDAPEINAFALPGGYIYVNRGLVERAATLDQFAGVLGHEIGHVVLRHSVERMQKATRTNVGVTAFCAITSLCEGMVTQAVINLAGNAWFARHSRADEAEADSNAVFNVMRAGVHPGGIPDFFETLLRERERSPGAIEGWFASHPLEEARVQSTRGLLASIGESRFDGLTRDAPAYQAFRERVIAIGRAAPPPSRQFP
jgi:beta-barrel assembly-enhancing protease